MPAKKSTTKRGRQMPPQQEPARQSVLVVEPWIGEPTPEEWAALRRFQAHIREELQRKYPLSAQEEQSA
jgi:hypothetical protein